MELRVGFGVWIQLGITVGFRSSVSFGMTPPPIGGDGPFLYNKWAGRRAAGKRGGNKRRAGGRVRPAGGLPGEKHPYPPAWLRGQPKDPVRSG